MQKANYLLNVFKKITTAILISYVETLFLDIKLGYQSPGRRSLTLLYTVVIGNRRDFLKRRSLLAEERCSLRWFNATDLNRKNKKLRHLQSFID